MRTLSRDMKKKAIFRKFGNFIFYHIYQKLQFHDVTTL